MTQFRIVIKPGAHARHLASGGRLADETLYEIAAAFVPQLLPVAHMDSLKRFLVKTSARGRGRPTKEVVGRRGLIAALEAVQREDFHEVIRTTLIARVADRRTYTELNRALPFHNKIAHLNRNNLICGLHPELESILAADPPYRHPILGEFPFRTVDPSKTLSERTYDALKEILLEFGFGSLETTSMRNIISQWRKMRSQI